MILGGWMAGKTTTASTSGSTTPSPTSSDTPTVDPVERQAELEARIAQYPDDADAHLELGTIFFNDENDLDGAKSEWETVIQIDPTLAEAWYDLGFYYLYQDPPDYTTAQQMWDKVVELDPTSSLAQTVQTHLNGLLPSSDPPTTPSQVSPTSSETGQ